MTTGRKNIAGLRKVFSRDKVIIATDMIIASRKRKGGRIVINSQSLRDNIGETARVVVYLRRKR